MIKRLDNYVYVGIPTSNYFTKRKRVITIQNNETFALQDFQVPIRINDINFIDKSSFRHLVLVLDGQKLPYWIEEWKRPSGKTKIWTKIPELPASGSLNLELFYDGYCDFGLLNGDDVFIFFDDFKDLSKWETASNVVIINDGGRKVAKLTDSSQIITTIDSIEKGIIECSIKAVSPSNYGNGIRFSMKLQNDNSTNNVHYGQECSLGSLGQNIVQNDNDIAKNNDQCPFDGYYHKLIGKLSGTHLQYIYDFGAGNLEGDIQQYTYNKYRLATWDDGVEVWCDYTFIRKYTANEPTISIEEEQTVFMHW